MADGDVTGLLIRWRNGDESALHALTPLVYDELRSLARRQLRRSRPGQTLQSTALAHEAWLRLVDAARVDWQSRAHFYGVAATVIRRLLVDRARARQADKRGGGATFIELDESLAAPAVRDLNVIALDDLLQTLAIAAPRQSRLVELRFFVGLSIEETAEVLGVSAATVKREWVAARSWILANLPRGAERES